MKSKENVWPFYDAQKHYGFLVISNSRSRVGREVAVSPRDGLSKGGPSVARAAMDFEVSAAGERASIDSLELDHEPVWPEGPIDADATDAFDYQRSLEPEWNPEPPVARDSDGVMLDRQQDQALFAHSPHAGVALTDVKMPWEQGVFKEIFGDGQLLPDPDMSMPVFDLTRPTLNSCHLGPQRRRSLRRSRGSSSMPSGI